MENIKAFALTGDRYHNSDYIRTALGKTLVRELGLTIDFTDETTLLNADTLVDYRMLLIFRDGMIWPEGYGEKSFLSRGGPVEITSDPPVPQRKAGTEPWMTPEQGRAVKAFVMDGGAALLYHNVTYIAGYNADFREVLGAATEGHPAMRPYRVKITDRDHPITRGVNDFVVTDEQHFLTYDRDPGSVLMQSVNEDGLTHKDLGTSCQAGWAFDFGKGRVCYLAPGHNIPTLWNPEYEKIQQNAVRWLLHP